MQATDMKNTTYTQHTQEAYQQENCRCIAIDAACRHEGICVQTNLDYMLYPDGSIYCEQFDDAFADYDAFIGFAELEGYDTETYC